MFDGSTTVRGNQSFPGYAGVPLSWGSSAGPRKGVCLGRSFQAVGAPTACLAVSIKQKEREWRQQKGVTPVRVSEMRPYLAIYPDRAVAMLLEEKFLEGFRIPSQVVGSGLVHQNFKSALMRPGVVTEKLTKEVAIGHNAGPFLSPPLPGLTISPLGLVPKKEPNKFSLIHHLSFLKGLNC